jgi:hypothetical protein
MSEKLIVKIIPKEFEILQSSQSSVELRRGPKGSVDVTIKAYAATVQEAADEAMRVFLKLEKKFPKTKE